MSLETRLHAVEEHTKLLNSKIDNLDVSALIDILHPVGEYYETSNEDFDPNVVWGGTWQLESEGMFHISGSTSGTYKVGTQGGSTKHKHGTSGHTLTVDEIPSHRHQTNDKVLIARSTAVFSNTPKYYGGNYETAYTNYVGGGKSHSHGDTGETTTLPPYTPVYRWHRTA